jgi:hypothetical protein
MSIMKKKDGSPRRKRFAAIGLATFVTLAGAGAAFAYWTTTGTGAGTGTTSAPAAVTVVQTSANVITAPGGSVALSGDFNNPNSGPTYITHVTATVGVFSSVAAFPSDPPCTAADFTITGTSNTPGDIAAGNGVGAWSGLTLTLTDSLTNQDNCQSLTTIPIVYAAS